MGLHEEVLEYYKAAAEYLGRKQKEDDEEGREETPDEKRGSQDVQNSHRADDGLTYPNQEGYSLLWFYRDLACPQWIEGRTVAAAFLGSEEARAALSFSKENSLPALPEEFLLETKFGLNNSQQAAVRRALANPISFIQGPPGTGKTEVILNLASCIVGCGGNLAVIANNGEALKNVQEKIEAACSGGTADKPNWKRLKESIAVLGSRDKRKEWNKKHPKSESGFAFSAKGEPANEAKGREESPEYTRRRRHGTINWEPDISGKEFCKHYPLVISTVHSLFKNFADTDAEFQFDYVVMDESSQASVLLGLLALAAGKHVVLVGDDEQLAPIYSEDDTPRIQNLLQKLLPPLPKEAKHELEPLELEPPYSLRDPKTDDGMSILVAAEQVFVPLGAPHTFLEEHYRCHPGIIGFCEEDVYTEPNEHLKVMTEGAGTPIRVRWFIGDYCELVPYSNTSRKRSQGKNKGSKHNMRQIAVFMEEEWPKLCKRLKNSDLRVAFLSPYRGQLTELLTELKKAINAEGEIPGFELKIEEEGEIGSSAAHEFLTLIDRNTLTIHKAQGKEYDIVYLLPVEDGDWEWPWSQGKRLINVAVSRAKSELVVICSANLMGEEVQRELRLDPVLPFPGKGDESPEEHERKEKQQRYLKRLIEYVGRRTGYKPEGEFGFHRSELRSVFDGHAALRGKDRVKVEGSNALSSYEKLFAQGLCGLDLDKYGLDWGYGVPLADCVVGDSPCKPISEALNDDGLKGFVESAKYNPDHVSHFDFVIYRKETREIVLAVEVDGWFHRCYDSRKIEGDGPGKLQERQERDKRKNEIVEALHGCVLEGNSAENWQKVIEKGESRVSFILLRLPTDGTTAFEFGGDGSLREDFVSVWDILEELCRTESERAVLIGEGVQIRQPSGEELAMDDDAWPTISQLLKKWKDDPSFPRMSGKNANDALVSAGYLVRENGGVRPTEKGRELGIREKHADNGNPYCKYPPNCEEELRACFLSGQEQPKS